MKPSLVTQNIEQDRVLFLLLAEAVASLGKDLGIDISPYSSPQLPYFTALPDGSRQAALLNLSQYLEICEQIRNAGYSIGDGPKMIWGALKYFKLRPPADLFDYMTEQNVFEIHDKNFFQIFRNFKFYELCSYTLEELYSFTWPELYLHDPAMQGQLIELAQRLFAGEYKSTIALNSPAHTIKERFSRSRLTIKAQVTHVAPLYQDKTSTVVAHLSVESGCKLARVENNNLESAQADRFANPASLNKGASDSIDL